MATSSLTPSQKRVIIRAARMRYGSARVIAIYLRASERAVAYELAKIRGRHAEA